MLGPVARKTSGRGAVLRWLLALTPLAPLLVTLFIGSEGDAMTLALQVLFTVAGGCHLLLAFELVAKLRMLGAGEPVPQIGVAALRVAISFALLWIAFALALGLHDAPPGAAFPVIYMLYCVAMLMLLLVAFGGAFWLGRLARARAVARSQRRPS